MQIFLTTYRLNSDSGAQLFICTAIENQSEQLIVLLLPYATKDVCGAIGSCAMNGVFAPCIHLRAMDDM